MKVLLILCFMTSLLGFHIAQASSKAAFYSSTSQTDIFNEPYGPPTQYQVQLTKEFAKFVYSLLKKEVEVEKIQFDNETQQYITQEIKLKSHIKVKLSDIIGGNYDKASKKNGLWVKPYVRDIYFQTRTMVCKYSYRSKYRKQIQSLSGHFVHENHGSLDCKDIEDGSKVRPFVFGDKNLVFIANIETQNNVNNTTKAFNLSSSKRNKTYY